MAEATLNQIKAYFGSDGYPEVANKEILDIKRDDPEGYEEIKKLVGEQLEQDAEAS